ncbi:uncharacterized protein LOC129571336 [Sitodiplosis mosellana]|uniref:uncharacterized protein LOC129571336 n=1 Tax=Sitodiplosis mosellana TaxID=263140 RepID=UPI0024438F55|nr:uncharacterized protein LOC129571336 [Sitodiplosis mosellana]
MDVMVSTTAETQNKTEVEKEDESQNDGIDSGPSSGSTGQLEKDSDNDISQIEHNVQSDREQSTSVGSSEPNDKDESRSQGDIDSGEHSDGHISQFDFGADHVQSDREEDSSLETSSLSECCVGFNEQDVRAAKKNFVESQRFYKKVNGFVSTVSYNEDDNGKKC